METIHLYNLSNLCRVCLSKTEVMSNLFESTKGLCNLFKSIVNIELEKNEAFPNYLCSNCEEKILKCQEFVEQCKKTNELLERYKSCDFKVEEETKIGLSSVPVTEIVEYISHDDSSEDSNNLQENESSPTTNMRRLRLKQYSYEEVIQAVEEQKKKFKDVRTCIICKFQGRNYRALSVHMSFIHKELKDNWCAICNAVFDDLKQHLLVHDETENNCQFCGKNLSSRGHLIEHLMSHTTIRPYKCEDCEKTFVSPRHLRIHHRTHTHEKPFSCKFCPSSFTQSYPLKAHLEKYHKNEGGFTCIHCKNVFENEELYRSHVCVTTVKEEPPVTCSLTMVKQNYCNVCCRKVRSLNIHNKKFHGNSKEVDTPNWKLCTVCGKQFKNSSKLKVHMRIHTGETPYSCSFCDKKMATRNHLVVHERMHTGERPHICPVCNKRFSQTSILNTHMKLHTGRPEMCMICGKRFCRPAELRLHMRKHTGEKPFVCSHCGKSFIQKSHLVEHARRHSDDKPFKCVHCGKSFRQRSSLKTHFQIHLGQKPFKCSQCPYACRQSHSLTIHMRQHSNDAPRLDKPYSCDYCQKNFTTVAMLNSHISYVHITNA